MELDPKMDEDFLNGEAKAHACVKMVEDMIDLSKTDADPPAMKLMSSTSHIAADFYVKQQVTAKKPDEINMRAFLNDLQSKQETLQGTPGPDGKYRFEDTAYERIKAARPTLFTMPKHTFVRLLDEDPEEAAKVTKERQDISQLFRTKGNIAFKKSQFVTAVRHYTRAIEYVADSPILYTSRAISYMSIKNYRRALMDCEKVLNELDNKNMRAWLYRGWAFKRMGDDRGFEDSVEMARKTNPRETDYIDQFLQKLNLN